MLLVDYANKYLFEPVGVPKHSNYTAQTAEDMTVPQEIENDIKFRKMLYGYLWWIIDAKKNIYAAIGNNGNVIYVNAEKAIVIVVASYFKPTIFDRIDFIPKYIEPYIEKLA